ncbi:MAG TPA: hypothetical protein VF996_02425 [Candidatus Saccharimonadales bacterium]|jgi:hypothetical protein
MRYCFEQFSRRPALLGLPTKVIAQKLGVKQRIARRAVERFAAHSLAERLVAAGAIIVE